eukprot:2938352-Rhodomonas_salina.3
MVSVREVRRSGPDATRELGGVLWRVGRRGRAETKYIVLTGSRHTPLHNGARTSATPASEDPARPGYC